MAALGTAALTAACFAGVVIASGGGPATDNSKEIERALDSRKPKNVTVDR